MAAVHTDNSMLTHVKSRLYLSGVLSHCVRVLSLDPRRLRGNWSAAATLAQLVRYISEDRFIYFFKVFILFYLLCLSHLPTKRVNFNSIQLIQF